MTYLTITLGMTAKGVQSSASASTGLSDLSSVLG